MSAKVLFESHDIKLLNNDGSILLHAVRMRMHGALGFHKNVTVNPVTDEVTIGKVYAVTHAATGMRVASFWKRSSALHFILEFGTVKAWNKVTGSNEASASSIAYLGKLTAGSRAGQ